MKAVNLLPPDLRSGGKGPAPAVSAGTEDAGGPGAFIVLGALALCVVALAGSVLTNNAVKDRKAKLADVTAQSAAATKQVEALKPYADFETLANARVKTVQDLATQRFDWEQALGDLSRTLPADVTLSQLTGTLSSVSGQGGGASSLRGAINAPAVELQGCTSGQTDVARLMARLRNVDGVTRVSLAKSDKDTPTTRSMRQGDTASQGMTDVTACGRGDRKPTFDVIAFFENDADTAVDPAGTDTTAAPGAPGAAPTDGSKPSGSSTGSPSGSQPANGQSTTTSATGGSAQGQSK
jgi:Tfp pilus assembly protein PilN